jgi:hypothetical protein
MRISFFALAAVLLVSGCNTWHENSYQKIIVQTPGVDNVECKLETEKNVYEVLTTRAITVERSGDPLVVTCHKAGYQDTVLTVDSKSHSQYFVFNMFNGFIPGTAYDIASNSIYSYPDTIIVTMQPTETVKLEEEKPYVLQKKAELVKPEPAPIAVEQTVPAEQAISKGTKK